MSDNEGHVTWDGHRTWYRRRGESVPGGQAPVVLLHGGPGATHDYLEPLLALADGGRPVVLYDQLGNGRSDHLRDAPSGVLDGRPVQARADLRARVARPGRAATCCSASRGAACSRSSTPSTGRRGWSGWWLPTRPRACRSGSRRPTGCATALPADVQADADRARAGRHDGLAGLQAAVDVFYHRHVCRARPVARAAAAGLRAHAGGPDGVRHDDRPERVPRHRDARASGTSRSAWRRSRRRRC